MLFSRAGEELTAKGRISHAKEEKKRFYARQE
jgi:hypothetical protein